MIQIIHKIYLPGHPIVFANVRGNRTKFDERLSTRRRYLRQCDAFNVYFVDYTRTVS